MGSGSLYPAGGRFSRGAWQHDAEGRALALGGVDPDATAHRRDEALGDEEAEAGVAGADVLTARVPAVELAEDVLLHRRGDADPLVDDAQLDAVLNEAGIDDHAAAGRRVADGVVQQDREHLPQLVAVRLGVEGLVGEVRDEDVAVAAVRDLDAA